MPACRRSEINGLCGCSVQTTSVDLTNDPETLAIIATPIILDKERLSNEYLDRTRKKKEKIPACFNTKRFVKNTTYLKMRFAGIDKIENVKNFKKLERLDLSHNRVNMLDGKEIPSSVERLNLNFNPVASIKDLKNVKNLTLLGIASKEKIKGLDQLSYAPFLTGLNLGGRPLPPIIGIKDLKIVFPSRILNQKEIAILKGATRKKTFDILDLDVENVCNPHQTKDAIVMNRLKLEGVPACVMDVKEPETVILSENKIKSMEDLSKINPRKLENLYLDGNKIKKMENISQFKKLETLDLSNNNIKIMEGLEEMGSLKTLVMKGNKLTSLGGFLSDKEGESELDPLVFNGLKKLERLDVSDNDLVGLQSIANVVDLKRLKELDLSGNERLPRSMRCGKKHIFLQKKLDKKEIKELKKCL